MTEIATADIQRRMGRPPLKAQMKTIKTTVRLTEDIGERIEAIAGPNRMAVFIREAIEAELIRREREASRKARG